DKAGHRRTLARILRKMIWIRERDLFLPVVPLLIPVLQFQCEQRTGRIERTPYASSESVQQCNSASCRKSNRFVAVVARLSCRSRARLVRDFAIGASA